MRFPTHLVPRAAKNLLPGYRRHWRHSYAALLSEAEQVVSNLTFSCLTVSYSDDGIEDEAPAAKKIAEHLGMDHEIVVIDPKNEPVDPASVIEILGHPNESTTALSVLQMSQTASSRGYKVGLTGAGGDEMFLGYGKNAYFYKHYGLFGLPQGIRRLFAKLTRPFGGWDLRINRLARDAFVSDAEQYLANKNFPAIDWLRKLYGFSEWSQETFGGAGHVAVALPKIEFDLILPGQRVVTFDHSSMAASLELRTPFLSRHLMETVSRFDPRAFAAIGQKNVARRILSRHLPNQLFNYHKTGFYYPQRLLLRGSQFNSIRIPGIPESLVSEVFGRMQDGGGWERIAVRLVSLYAFLNQAEAPAKPAIELIP